jgi:hypothetical protein
MDRNERHTAVANTGVRLSTLWIFAMFNYLYCDIAGLMDASLLKQYLTGNVQGLHVTQGLLLAGAVLMEIPIAMTVLSRVTRRRTNRRLNIIAGTVMTIAQSATLLTDSPTTYYVFFSAIEIACTSLIVWYAWNWRVSEVSGVPRAG